MNEKKITAVFCAAALACTAFAKDVNPEAAVEETDDGLTFVPGEGISYGEQSLLTAEFGLSFDSKYITYGVMDGKDPIIVPNATLTFLDWVYFGVETIFDVTKGNGKRGEYGNRAGRYTTIDSYVGIAHEFEITDDLALSVDFNYIYEFIDRYQDDDIGDTQYLNLELGLSGYWVEPTLWIERDIMLDNGTYVNLELGHTFTLIGTDDDPTLTFRPAIGQGFGNTQRVRGYFTKNHNSDEALDHGGLMDTTIKGEFEWCITDWMSIGAYIAYYDYLLDSNMRDGARAYNGSWGDADRYRRSWNFVAGVGLTVTF